MEVNELIDFIKKDRESLIGGSGIRFSSDELEDMLNDINLDVIPENKRYQDIIQSYSMYFLDTLLTNSFTPEVMKVIEKEVLFFYNMSTAFGPENAVRQLEICYKLVQHYYSFDDMIEVMKGIANKINTSIMASKVEYESSRHFIDIITGASNEER